MTPNIKPDWRTSTVVALCLSMRETRDYSALPILADALQDADCDDVPTLDFLRDPTAGRTDAERMVACVMSEQGRDAVQRIDEIAAGLGPNYGYDDESDGNPPIHTMDYGFLMESAETWLQHDDYTTQIESETWRSYFPAHADAFWGAYQIVTGKFVPGTKQHSFFSCSC